MQLIDGKAIAARIHDETRAQVDELKARGIVPGLAVVLVGDDPASRAYVRSKDRKCHELGLHSIKHELPVSTTQDELLSLVRTLNADASIHGILVQSPPPSHIDEAAVIEVGQGQRHGATIASGWSSTGNRSVSSVWLAFTR